MTQKFTGKATIVNQFGHKYNFSLWENYDMRRIYVDNGFRKPLGYIDLTDAGHPFVRKVGENESLAIAVEQFLATYVID